MEHMFFLNGFFKKMKGQITKMHLLEFRLENVFGTYVTFYIGNGDCVCDASEGDGKEIDGILFLTDSGEYVTLTEDEIERIELLDGKEHL